MAAENFTRCSICLAVGALCGTFGRFLMMYLPRQLLPTTVPTEATEDSFSDNSHDLMVLRG